MPRKGEDKIWRGNAEAAGHWKTQSALVIAPGKWTLRNGAVAIVTKILQLPYGDPPKMFPVAFGTAGDVPLTWNMNGTFAAAGRHQYDIVKAS